MNMSLENLNLAITISKEGIALVRWLISVAKSHFSIKTLLKDLKKHIFRSHDRNETITCKILDKLKALLQNPKAWLVSPLRCSKSLTLLAGLDEPNGLIPNFIAVDLLGVWGMLEWQIAGH